MAEPRLTIRQAGMIQADRLVIATDEADIAPLEVGRVLARVAQTYLDASLPGDVRIAMQDPEGEVGSEIAWLEHEHSAALLDSIMAGWRMIPSSVEPYRRSPVLRVSPHVDGPVALRRS